MLARLAAEDHSLPAYVREEFDEYLHRARAPTSAQLTQLAVKIARRVCRHLTRKGWLEGEDESAFLSDFARPAVSEKRLSLSPQGRVRYQLKTLWKNGTTHVEFEPVDVIAKLAALVPPPRAHLTASRVSLRRTQPCAHN